MTGTATSETVALTVALRPAEDAALAAAARRAGLLTAELARILLLYGLERLQQGDAGVLRAVKGSRDASVR